MDNSINTDVNISTATEKDLAPEKPLSLGGHLRLDISEEELDLHTGHILKRLNDIEQDEDRQKMLDLVETWRNQYLGAVGEKSFPFPGAFNLDMRLTPKIQDAVVAQTEEAFDDTATRWTIGPATNKEMMDIRYKQEKVLDYFEDTEMSNNEDLEAIRHDAFLFGLGWEAVLFERRFDRIRELRTYKTIEEFIKDFPDDYSRYTGFLQKLSAGEEIKIIVEANQERRRSPVRRHIKFEDVLCPSTAKGIDGVNEADIIGRRVWMKWHEIKDLEDNGDYIKGVSERLKYLPGLNKDGMLEEDPEYFNKSFEVFEVIYQTYLTINGKKRRVKTLFNVEKEHRVCLRAIRYPYDHNRSYLIPHCIKYTNDGLYQDGVGRMLQDIHIAGNATINHILDASVIANSMSFKVREGSNAARRVMEARWYPGSTIQLQNMDDVQQFNFSTPNLNSLISLFGIIERFAADVSGVVNYTMGISDPEDPEAPASKTIALMRKAEIKLRRYIKNLKRSEDEAGFQALRLIYQYISPERLSEIIGEPVAETKDFLQPPMKVIANSSGFAIEKIFERKDDMTMASLLLKLPFLQDPVRMSRLTYTLAKDYGSNWDKKIIGIVPTPEEVEAEKAQAQMAQQQKKIELGQKAAQQALEQGASPEEAREIANNAMSMAENMRTRQMEMAQGEQQGR